MKGHDFTATVLIADDETPAREKIKRLLASRTDLIVVAEAANGKDAIALISERRPDIAILDIQMPKGTGFEVVEAVTHGRDPNPAFIFATAYDDHAIRAFDVAAVDYLLKPFNQERLHQAINRAREQIDNKTTAPALAALLKAAGLTQPSYLRRIAAESKGRQVLLPTADVTHLVAEKNYVGIWSAGREFLVRRTLSSIADQLDPNDFTRVHRSAVVNLNHVKEIVTAGRGDKTLFLTGGQSLRMSRTYRGALSRIVDPKT